MSKIIIKFKTEVHPILFLSLSNTRSLKQHNYTKTMFIHNRHTLEHFIEEISFLCVFVWQFVKILPYWKQLSQNELRIEYERITKICTFAHAAYIKKFFFIYGLYDTHECAECFISTIK